MKALVIGASGQIGGAIGARLLHDGWDVTCAQRGEPLPELIELGATSLRCDRDEPGALRRITGDGADVLVDAVAFDENHAYGLLEIQDVVGHYVVISSASVYRDEQGRTIDEARTFDELPKMPVPISETQPTVSPGSQTYSTKKIALEQTMLDQCRSVVSIIRPCAIYGRHSKHPREWWFVKRMLDQRKHIPLQFEQNMFQTSATVNIAEVIVTAINASFNGVLNAGDPDAPSIREIGTIIAAAFAWQGTFVSAPAGAEVGTTPWSVLHPFVLSMDSASRLGYRPATTYSSEAPLTCRWLESAAKGNDWRVVFPMLMKYPELFNYAAEDAFFSPLA